MAQTFQDAWRPARLHLAAVPVLLVRDWVQDAYTRACERRNWGFLRKEASIDTIAAREETLTFTQGSTSVTSAAIFVATDAGRQLKVSTYPVYTIASVTNASTIVLDRNFAEPGGAQTATIFNAYFTTPADFRQFLIVVDPYNRRIIPFWMNQDEIGLADPARSNSDSGPRYLVAQGYSTATATLGQARYEYWPYPTSERHYPYLYIRQAERFADDTPLPGMFANRADLLKLGAQMMAADWPGTLGQRNPYYNPALADRLTKKWEFELQKLELADDAQYPDDLIPVHWTRQYGPLARTTEMLRQTDASVYDYL